MNSAPGWILGRCEKYDFGGVLAKIPEGEGPCMPLDACPAFGSTVLCVVLLCKAHFLST